MTSLVMLADRALSMALRRRGLPPGSPPPARAATEISRISLVKIFPRRASSAPLRASIEGPLPMPATLALYRGETSILTRPAPARSGSTHAPPGGTASASAREGARLQEPGDLPHRLGRKQQSAVRGVDHDMVGQPGNAGLVQLDRAVVHAVEARDQRAQS